MVATSQLVDAIRHRHSVRTFSSAKPSAAQMDVVRRAFALSGLDGEWYDCRICIKIADGKEFETGYRLEMVALEAVAVGLATCWKSIRSGVALEFGLKAEKPSVKERIFKMFLKFKPRANKGTVSGKFSLVAQLVNRAPSAYNRQPWRLAATDDFIVLSFAGTSRLDKVSFGIAALHLDVARSYISRNHPNA